MFYIHQLSLDLISLLGGLVLFSDDNDNDNGMEDCFKEVFANSDYNSDPDPDKNRKKRRVGKTESPIAVCFALLNDEDGNVKGIKRISHYEDGREVTMYANLIEDFNDNLGQFEFKDFNGEIVDWLEEGLYEIKEVDGRREI